MAIHNNSNRIFCTSRIFRNAIRIHILISFHFLHLGVRNGSTHETLYRNYNVRSITFPIFVWGVTYDKASALVHCYT